MLLDTSVAVALSVVDHEGRAASLSTVDGMRIPLAGHAAFEAFSVLTRLPGLARRTPAAVGRLLAANFPYSRFLDEKPRPRCWAGWPGPELPAGQSTTRWSPRPPPSTRSRSRPETFAPSALTGRPMSRW